MNAKTTRTVQLMHNSSIPNARWCETVGWEPQNKIDGAEFIDGSWWNEDSEEAGLVYFCNPAEYGSGDVVEASLDDIRVASCGDCRVIGEVE